MGSTYGLSVIIVLEYTIKTLLVQMVGIGIPQYNVQNILRIIRNGACLQVKRTTETWVPVCT